MNELDFIDALSDRSTKRASIARELVGKLKTSDFKGIMSGAADLAKKHPEAVAGLSGAAITSALAYINMRKGNKKQSLDQRAAALYQSSIESQKDQAEREGRPLTFAEEMTAAAAPTIKLTADAYAKHPVKGALLIAPIGAYAGLQVLKRLT